MMLFHPGYNNSGSMLIIHQDCNMLNLPNADDQPALHIYDTNKPSCFGCGKEVKTNCNHLRLLVRRQVIYNKLHKSRYPRWL